MLSSELKSAIVHKRRGLECKGACSCMHLNMAADLLVFVSSPLKLVVVMPMETRCSEGALDDDENDKEQEDEMTQ